MYLPRDYDKEEFARIKEAAAKIREDSDVLVVAGIGGSYLGARAVIEAVKGQFHNELENGPKIYFCGNSISPTYLNNIISLCKGKRFSINVISKSGTTTETSSGLPRAARAAGEGDGRGRGQQAHLRHHRPCQGHPEAAGRRTGLAHLRGPRRRGRPLLRAERRGPAAHCCCRYRASTT